MREARYDDLRQKRHSPPPAARDGHLSTGIIANFGDNAVSGIVALETQYWRRVRMAFDWTHSMSSLKSRLAILAAGLLLTGCMETATYEATNTSNFKPRDKELLAKVRYENVQPAESFRRAIVDYHRKEAPGTIVVDSDNRYLYYVMAKGKAVRYGIAVGEEAQAWSGVAKVGRMEEWPGWTPTPGEQQRLGPLPAYVTGGPHNPLGARGLYLFSGNKDTLYRIHGTNQPEYIGQAISSGCIRMTNEDVIDLYGRVKLGTIVVVLAPQSQGIAPARVASGLESSAHPY